MLWQSTHFCTVTVHIFAKSHSHTVTQSDRQTDKIFLFTLGTFLHSHSTHFCKVTQSHSHTDRQTDRQNILVHTGDLIHQSSDNKAYTLPMSYTLCYDLIKQKLHWCTEKKSTSTVHTSSRPEWPPFPARMAPVPGQNGPGSRPKSAKMLESYTVLYCTVL